MSDPPISRKRVRELAGRPAELAPTGDRAGVPGGVIDSIALRAFGHIADTGLAIPEMRAAAVAVLDHVRSARTRGWSARRAAALYADGIEEDGAATAGTRLVELWWEWLVSSEAEREVDALDLAIDRAREASASGEKGRIRADLAEMQRLFSMYEAVMGRRYGDGRGRSADYMLGYLWRCHDYVEAARSCVLALSGPGSAEDAARFEETMEGILGLIEDAKKRGIAGERP